MLSSQAASFLATVDARGHIAAASESLAKALGRTRAAIEGTRFIDLFGADCHAAMAEQLRSLAKPGAETPPPPIEARLLHGSELVVRWQLERLAPHGGDAEALVLASGTPVLASDARSQATQQRTQLLHRFHEVSRLIGHEQDPARLLQATCELLVAADALEACVIVLTDEGAVKSTTAAGEPEQVARLRAVLDCGRLPECIRQALSAPVLVPTSGRADLCNLCPAGGHDHDHEALAMPLGKGGQAHGVLLALWSVGALTDELRALLGELCSDLASALDATTASRQRDEAMKELRLTRDRLEALVSASPAAIVSLDLERRVVTWSRSAEEIFGWTAAEAIGQPMPIVPPDKEAQLDTLFQRTLQGRTFSRLELDRQRRDGSSIPVSLSTAPLRSADGELTGVLAVLVDLSDQRRMERSVQDSEIQLDTLLANLPGMAYRCRNDESWTMMFASDGCIELTGYTPAELVGSARVAYADLIHPDDAAEVWRQVQEAIEQQRSFVLEYRIRTAQGEDKWVWEHGRALRGSKGELWLEGLITDISRTKKSELALIDRIEDLRCLLDTAAILARDIPRDEALAAVAQRLPSIYREPEQVVARIVVGQDVHVSHGAREHDTNDSCQHAPIRVGGEEVGTIEIRHPRPPRGDAPDALGADAQLVVDGIAGQVGGFVERQRIAAALRESEARMRALYQRLPIPTFVWQRYEGDFVLTDYNEAARHSSRGHIASWVGQRSRQAHADRPDIIEDFERCFAERGSFEREMTFRYRQIGTERQLVVTYGFVAPDMVLVHTQDVTAQRQVEEQLRLAQRLEAIGRLAGGIAHDFNNILTVISSCADFALDAVALDAPVRRDLREIRIAADRAASLTRQLLAFSRKQILRPAVLDLNQVARAMEIMLRRLLGEDIFLEARLDDDLGAVKADRGQLEQVIMNVAVNSRDAMPEGGTLVIETENREIDAEFAARHPECHPGPHVMLAITDNGQGMDAATLARAFEPFFTTKDPGKGTGLGLSTAYGIVAQSGGCVAVHSHVDEGTRVEIYLPRVDEEVSADSPEETHSHSGHETILLVEDEASVRELVARILELAGYRVLTASNGPDALQAAAQHVEPIDLLLTDVIMPRLSGRDVAEALLAQRPGLRVLFMSGYTDDAIVHHGVLESGTHFLGKPFSREDLLAKVRAALSEPLAAQPDGDDGPP